MAIAFDAIHDALLSRGFIQAAALHPVRYSGFLKVGNDSVPVFLEFFDFELQRLPIIRLADRPSWVPMACNHVDSRNVVCYANSGLAFIDRYQADRQVLFCLDSAARTLNDIRKGNVLGDVPQEFTYYWQGAPILVDADRLESSQPMNVVSVKLTDRNLEILISRNQNGLEKYANYSPAQSALDAAVLIPATRTPAAVVEAWPPTNLQQLLGWLRAQAPDLAKSLRKAIGSLNGLGNRRALFMFQAEPAWFGFGFAVPTMVGAIKFHQAKGFINAIESRSSKIEIERYTPIRIDSRYLVERNLRDTEKPLLDKRVLLVGCGAIGGHLAHALARSGAGFGSGTLFLCDPDIFTAGNLGRHRLGFEALLLSKVKALQVDLEGSLPGVKIQTASSSVLDLRLQDFDLVLDATGEEQLSDALNERFLSRKSSPIIFVWVVGNGLAVQSFTLASHDQGCLRCWKSHDEKTSFIPAEREQLETRIGRGCDDPFVPFSGSSPLFAAGLALQATLDWASDRPNPTLRTVEIDFRSTRHIKPKSPSKSEKCPACGKR